MTENSWKTLPPKFGMLWDNAVTKHNGICYTALTHSCSLQSTCRMGLPDLLRVSKMMSVNNRAKKRQSNKLNTGIYFLVWFLGVFYIVFLDSSSKFLIFKLLQIYQVLPQYLFCTCNHLLEMKAHSPCTVVWVCFWPCNKKGGLWGWILWTSTLIMQILKQSNCILPE